MQPVEFSPEWFYMSSQSWLANKKRVGASYVYVCSMDLCKRVIKEGFDMCSIHMRLAPNNHISHERTHQGSVLAASVALTHHTKEAKQSLNAEARLERLVCLATSKKRPLEISRVAASPQPQHTSGPRSQRIQEKQKQKQKKAEQSIAYRVASRRRVVPSQ